LPKGVPPVAPPPTDSAGAPGNADPKNGIRNVKSDVLLLVWDKFQAHGIEIPFPQRDLHLKTPMEIKVATRSADGAAETWSGAA
jgi:small-conductance mechanosensitive channel